MIHWTHLAALAVVLISVKGVYTLADAYELETPWTPQGPRIILGILQIVLGAFGCVCFLLAHA